MYRPGGPDLETPGKEVCAISAYRNEAARTRFQLLQTQ